MSIDEQKKSFSQSKQAIRIKTIGRVCEHNRGQPTWPLYMYKLIIEQLVNGTPPSSINGNIILLVNTFAPRTVVSELQSICTIQRTRIILLIVVQSLAAYRLARCEKCQQLFTDGTNRRQTSIQNLAIRI